jgi:protein-tyrosine phosphatase
MISILFVCAGNICRSPALAAALQKLVQENGLAEDVFIDSCAVTPSFLGAPADPRMVAAAHKRGVHIEHKAKIFEETYFKVFDYIFAVDQEVLKVLQSMAPSNAEKAKLHLATEFSTTFKGKEIPDPYFDGESGFETVMDMSQDIAHNILTQVLKN